MRYLAPLLIPAALFAGEIRYARLGEFSGHVEVQLHAGAQWTTGERNLPLLESSWLRTSPGSRAEIELDTAAVLRLGPETKAGLSDYTTLSTGQHITLFSVDEGIAYLSGHAAGNDSLMLVAPGAHVTIGRDAVVRVEASSVRTSIAVLHGSVRFVCAAAELELRQGQTARAEPNNTSRFILDREVDELELDKWIEARPALSTGADQRYGQADLDAAGNWIASKELGMLWKPRDAEGWTPFRNGRWQWYDTLGYTWISSEPWGWLPYHYGRWRLDKELGWVWQSSAASPFHGGDVYWMRGKDFIGWGPLNIAETYPSPDPAKPQPQLFLPANTSYASFKDGDEAIDPTGFTARPKDPLREAAFITAPPSPLFISSKLDARRPKVELLRTRINPLIESGPVPTTTSRVVVPQPTLPPVVVVTQPAPAPQEVPVPYAVPYAVPVAVPVIAPAHNTAKPANVLPTSPTLPPNPGRGRGVSRAPNPPQRKWRDDREAELANQAVDQIDHQDFAKALVTLDTWSRQYPQTELIEHRLYYLLQTFAGLDRSAEAVNVGAKLLGINLATVFPNQGNLIVIYSLTAMHAQRLRPPTPQQASAGRQAATLLLAVLPEYFSSRNRPESIRPEDWTQARAGLETLGKQTLALFHQ